MFHRFGIKIPTLKKIDFCISLKIELLFAQRKQAFGTIYGNYMNVHVVANDRT